MKAIHVRLSNHQLEKKVQASLHRKLNRERKARENQFAAEHASDTDEELYKHLKERKRRPGKKMTPESAVGCRYCVKRLGPWMRFMTQINGELAEKKMALRGNENAEEHARGTRTCLCENCFPKH